MSVQIIAILDKDVYKDHEKNRRIYSVNGLCPTIITSNGGGHIPKIMVAENEIEERHE